MVRYLQYIAQITPIQRLGFVVICGRGNPSPYKNRNTLPTAVIFILPYDVVLLVKWLCCHIAGERAFLHIVRYLQYIAQIVVQKRKIWYNVDNDKFALVFLGAKYEN